MPTKANRAKLYRASVDFRRLFEEAPNMALMVGRDATAFLAPFDSTQKAVVIIIPVDGEAADTLTRGTWHAGQLIQLLVPKLVGLLGGTHGV